MITKNQKLISKKELDELLPQRPTYAVAGDIFVTPVQIFYDTFEGGGSAFPVLSALDRTGEKKTFNARNVEALKTMASAVDGKTFVLQVAKTNFVTFNGQTRSVQTLKATEI